MDAWVPHKKCRLSELLKEKQSIYSERIFLFTQWYIQWLSLNISLLSIFS